MSLTKDLGFTTMAPSPIARFESAVATVGGEMFVIGGHMEPDLSATDACYAFSPERNTWRACAKAPKAISHLTATVTDDRYIWLVGGYEGQHPGVGTKASFRYDAVDDTWDDCLALPDVRASGGLAVVERNLHYIGGLAADRCTNTDEHWVLDVDNPDKWRKLAPVPKARTHAATATINGQIYIIGGHYGHDVPGKPGEIAPSDDLDFVHKYDPVSDRWDEVAPLSRRRSHCEPGTFVQDGRIICIGGKNGSQTTRCQCEKHIFSHLYNRLVRKVQIKLGQRREGATLDDVIAYDPATDRWSDIGRLPQQLYAPAAGSVNGQVIVTNGGQKLWQNPSVQTLALDL